MVFGNFLPVGQIAAVDRHVDVDALESWEA